MYSRVNAAPASLKDDGQDANVYKNLPSFLIFSATRGSAPAALPKPSKEEPASGKAESVSGALAARVSLAALQALSLGPPSGDSKHQSPLYRK